MLLWFIDSSALLLGTCEINALVKFGGGTSLWLSPFWKHSRALRAIQVQVLKGAFAACSYLPDEVGAIKDCRVCCQEPLQGPCWNWSVVRGNLQYLLAVTNTVLGKMSPLCHVLIWFNKAVMASLHSPGGYFRAPSSRLVSQTSEAAVPPALPLPGHCWISRGLSRKPCCKSVISYLFIWTSCNCGVEL